jgi:hypothetical protein
MKIIEDAIFAIFSDLRCEYIVDGFIMIELSLNRIRLPVIVFLFIQRSDKKADKNCACC